MIITQSFEYFLGAHTYIWMLNLRKGGDVRMAWAFWLAVGAVLIVAEMFTLTFYLLWLGIGALAAFAVALLFPEGYVLQILTGSTIALLLTFYTKPLTRKVRNSRGFRDAIDDLVGKQGIVVEAIDKGTTGIVRVGNETWSAKSDVPIAQGEQVIVVNRGSTVLEVQKWGGL
jgi:membrane protein implicated in regulation of membrane protease activity